MDTQNSSRRDFLINSFKGITAFTVGSSFLTFLQSCTNNNDSNPTSSFGNGDTKVDIDISEQRFASLNNVGSAIALESTSVSGLPANGIFIIRTSETNVTVLDRTCTHQGCQVGRFGSNGIAICPCHGAEYNESGGVVRGPAARSLHQYPATLNGTLIEITI